MSNVATGHQLFLQRTSIKYVAFSGGDQAELVSRRQDLCYVIKYFHIFFSLWDTHDIVQDKKLALCEPGTEMLLVQQNVYLRILDCEYRKDIPILFFWPAEFGGSVAGGCSYHGDTRNDLRQCREMSEMFPSKVNLGNWILSVSWAGNEKLGGGENLMATFNVNSRGHIC